MVLYRKLPVEVTWPGKVKKEKKKQKERAPKQHPELRQQEQTAWKLDLEQMTPEKKRRRRAVQRQTRAAVVEAAGGSSSLREAAVGPATRQRYQNLWKTFLAWKNPQHFRDIDQALEAYLQELYLQGEDLSVGNYVVAAVLHRQPELRAKGCLARAQQALKGWRNLHPPKSRMPLPYEVICLVVVTAIQQGKLEEALAILLTFFLYLRPTEFQQLRVQDVVKPVRRGGKAYRHWSILLHPMEEGIPSKTKQWDEALTLDLAHMASLGPAMSTVLRLGQRGKRELAFSVTSLELNNMLEEQWPRLQLQSLGNPHMYRLRHGGATYELANGLRSLQEVQLRGRWKAVKSLKNYEKGGRLAQLFGSLDEEVQQRCVDASLQLDRVLRSLH